MEIVQQEGNHQIEREPKFYKKNIKIQFTSRAKYVNIVKGDREK